MRSIKLLKALKFVEDHNLNIEVIRTTPEKVVKSICSKTGYVCNCTIDCRSCPFNIKQMKGGNRLVFICFRHSDYFNIICKNTYDCREIRKEFEKIDKEIFKVIRDELN